MQEEFRTHSKTGLCFYCLEPIEALQPGGLNPRHVADQVAYGQCRKTIEPKWEPEQIWNGQDLVDEAALKNQDYTTPHYTPEQRHEMVENYIRRGTCVYAKPLSGTTEPVEERGPSPSTDLGEPSAGVMGMGTKQKTGDSINGNTYSHGERAEYRRTT